MRAEGQHKQCTTCVMHKLLMRKLGANQEARRAQARLWGAHMNLQWADRNIYWQHRSMSRVGMDQNGSPVISAIVDSMGHAKWAVPRSACLHAKTFNTFHRPQLTVTALIAHGRGILLALGEPYVTQGGDWTCELVAHLFHWLTANNIDLRECHIRIQADNATKECKNNSLARLLSLYVGRRRVRSCQLNFCLSGHSHEDVDQFFSLLSSYLQRQRELPDSEAFAEALRQYMSNPGVRPHEPLRAVVKIDRVRDWRLGLRLSTCCVRRT